MWDEVHRATRVERRYLCWETGLDAPNVDVPARFAPSYQLGMVRPAGPPIAGVATGWEITRVDPARVDRVAAAQRAQFPAFDEGYRDYLLWLYTGLAERGGVTLAAVDEGAIVGAVSVVVDPDPGAPPAARLREVWTARTHRRRGIATALVEAVSRWLPEHALWLATEADGPAVGIYRRAGFAEASRFTEASSERPRSSG